MTSFEKIDELMVKRNARELKKQSATETLIKYGLLIPASSVTLYHGRVSKSEDVDMWKVDPAYKNANNDSGHKNLNSVNALSTSPDYKTAASYAVIEAMGKKDVKPEIYEIVADSDDAYIINNFDFNITKFTPEQQKEIYSALNVYGNYGITQLAPVDFEFRDYARVVLEELMHVAKEKTGMYISVEDVDAVFAELKEKLPQVQHKAVSDLAGAINAKIMLGVNPSKLIEHYAIRTDRDNRTTLEDKSKMTIVDVSGNVETCPMNHEYISAWLASNNIIGISENVGVNNCLLFDLERVNTEKAQGEKLQSIISQFGEISQLVENLTTDDKLNKFFEMASPQEMIEVMENHSQIKLLLDAKAGVWEGFSIGDHTETTLRVFEESFERTVPKEIAPFIKMAMVCHDIGKGVAKSRATMHEETQKYSKDLLDYFSVTQPIQNMLLFAIGEGQAYTSAYYINQNIAAEEKLFERCQQVIADSFGKEPSEAEVNGFVSLCKIIQNCDSGAYTRYGVTRDKSRKVYNKNGNDRFTMSFHKPVDLKGRSQHMIDPKERI